MSNVPQPAGGRRHRWTRGNRLRAARENMPGSPSQKTFAAMVGISRNSVTRYESDVKGADKPIVLIRWAEVTGYDQTWLETGESGAPELVDLSILDTPTDRYRHSNDGWYVDGKRAPYLFVAMAA